MPDYLRLSGRVIFFCISVIFLFNVQYLDAAIFRIDQSKIRLAIAPGGAKSGEIKIDNPTDTPMNLRVYLEDWVYTSSHDGTKDFMLAGQSSFSCADWITFFPSEFNIPAFGSKRVNYTIKVPSHASGGHYGVMFFESALGDSGFQAGVGMNFILRIGVIFYIEPEGTIRQTLGLDEFNLSRDKDEPLSVSLDLQNTGNVDITCAGTFHILDKQGLVYARGAFNDIYTLPGDRATLKGLWKEAISQGKYDLIITLDLSRPSGALATRQHVLTKEVEIEIDKNGQVIKVGDLK